MYEVIDGMAYFYHPNGSLIRVTKVNSFYDTVNIFHETTCKHFVVCDTKSHNVLFIGYIHCVMENEYELVTLITHNNKMNRNKI